MSSQCRVEASAQTDFLDAYKWYAARQAKIADQFEAEVQRCISLAAAHPLQYPTVAFDYRRIPVRQFPYNVYFRMEPQEVVIVAIVHTRRSSDTWLRRKN